MDDFDGGYGYDDDCIEAMGQRESWEDAQAERWDGGDGDVEDDDPEYDYDEPEYDESGMYAGHEDRYLDSYMEGHLSGEW